MEVAFFKNIETEATVEEMQTAIDLCVNSGVRVFWFVMDQSNSRLLMKMAYEAGIVGDGYAWIGPHAVAARSFYTDDDGEFEPQVLNTVVGMLATAPRVDDGDDNIMYEWLNNEVKARGRDVDFPSFAAEDGADVSFYCAYSFDATLAIALGLSKTLDQNLTPRDNGTTFYNNIINSTFYGASGYVEFYENGDRAGGYDIVNILSNGTIQKIGSFTDNLHMDNSRTILWPGAVTVMPSDGILDDDDDETTSLMGVVLSLIFFVLLCMLSKSLLLYSVMGVIAIVMWKLGKLKRDGDDDAFVRQWTLDPSEIELQEEIGQGRHSIVFKGNYRSMSRVHV